MEVVSKINRKNLRGNKPRLFFNIAISVLGLTLLSSPIIAKNHHRHHRAHTHHVHQASGRLQPSFISATNSQQETIKNQGLFINELVGHSHSSDRIMPPFSLPVHGQITSYFGLRRFENESHFRAHNGIDIAVPTGTPIHASADGKVLNTGYYFYTGKTVFLDHGHGLVTMYAHLNRINVRIGQTLRQGQILGLSGQTGLVTGPHLHWSVIRNGVRVNPLRFIADKWNSFRHQHQRHNARGFL